MEKSSVARRAAHDHQRGLGDDAYRYRRGAPRPAPPRASAARSGLTSTHIAAIRLGIEQPVVGPRRYARRSATRSSVISAPRPAGQRPSPPRRRPARPRNNRGRTYHDPARDGAMHGARRSRPGLGHAGRVVAHQALQAIVIGAAQLAARLAHEVEQVPRLLSGPWCRYCRTSGTMPSAEISSEGGIDTCCFVAVSVYSLFRLSLPEIKGVP